MTPEKLKLTIGGQEFSVQKPLAFGQLRVVEPLITDLFSDVRAKKRWDRAAYDRLATVIVQCVGSDLNAEKLDLLPTTSEELLGAFQIICDASCMFRKVASEEDKKPGEAPASIGATSTPT